MFSVPLSPRIARFARLPIAVQPLSSPNVALCVNSVFFSRLLSFRMPQKRRRTPWNDLDDAHINLFSPSRTTVAHNHSEILVTPAGHHSSTENDLKSSPPPQPESLQHTPLKNLERAADAADYLGTEDSPTLSSPLIVSRQDIINARTQLGLPSISPPSQQTVSLDPKAARIARALLISAKQTQSIQTPKSSPSHRSPSSSPALPAGQLFREDLEADDPPELKPQQASPEHRLEAPDDTTEFEQNPNLPSTKSPKSSSYTPNVAGRISTGSVVTPIPLRLRFSREAFASQSPLETAALQPAHQPPPPVTTEQPVQSSPITPGLRSAMPSSRSGPVQQAEAAQQKPSPPVESVIGFTTAGGRTLHPTTVPSGLADLFEEQADLDTPSPFRKARRSSSLPVFEGRHRQSPLPDSINCANPQSPTKHPQQDFDAPNLDELAKSLEKPQTSTPPLFSTGRGKALPVQPLPNSMFQLHDNIESTNDVGKESEYPLFSTGAGKPLNSVVPRHIFGDSMATCTENRLESVVDRPLFTTGAGKPIEACDVVMEGAKSGAPLFMSGIKNSANAPLFTTGRGNPVDGLLLTSEKGMRSDASFVGNHKGRVVFAPEVHNMEHCDQTVSKRLRSNFSTPSPALRLGFPGALEGSVAAHMLADKGAVSTEQRLLLRGPVAPSGKTPPTDELRKTLFGEPGRGESAKRGVARFGRARNTAGSGLKTTPFKSPRVVHKHKAIVKTKENQVPRFVVPRLRKGGGFACDGLGHVCGKVEGELNNGFDKLFSGDFNILKDCLAFSFPRSHWGSVDCLPDAVKGAKSLWETSTFSVDNCITWIHELFGVKKIDGAATCVGSDSWTRMSYALAVLKLRRISVECCDCPHLSAAGVVRELLRRIEVEWHCNSQSWLLRIARGDTNAGCHFVGSVVEFEISRNDDISFVITDGWYVLRIEAKGELAKMMSKGWLRAGAKVHLFGATLHNNDNIGGRDWVFGNGDEISDNVLHVQRNSIFKASANRQHVLKMGLKPMLFVRKLKVISESGGAVSGISVMVLKSYPTCYLETVVENIATDDGEEEEKHINIWRREEAETAQRIEYMVGIEKERIAAGECDGFFEEHRPRRVIAVRQLLVCGIDDDVNDCDSRKILRIYNCSEDMDHVLQREGVTLHARNVVPKINGPWTCRPDAICAAKLTVKPSPRYPLSRTVATVDDLKHGRVRRGTDFDGVFYVVYRAVTSHHFVYLSDDTGDAVSLIALQLCQLDEDFLPRAFLPSEAKQGVQETEAFPVVVVTDVLFEQAHVEWEVVHARTTLLTSISAGRKLCGSSKRRSSVPQILGERAQQLEHLLTSNGEARAQLQILREAVASFCSGQRPSVAAYFSGTQ